MTDSMNFGPEWLRNLSSDGSTTGGTGGGARYQLSGYRYGREEMLGLYEKGFKPPASLLSFTTLYSEQPLVPLVLTPTTEEERTWPNRTAMMNTSMRGGRGTSLERGGRISRGRGSYQSYGRNVSTYESGGGWGNGEQADWSPRKDFNYRSSSVDNWRRNRSEEEEDWRSSNQSRGPSEKWGRSTSWRDGDKVDERGGGGGPQERPRNWHENNRGHGQRRGWDCEDLPEWATEHLGEGGGTFDSSGAYHGSDEEKEQKRSTTNKKDTLQKSSSQHNISSKQPPLTTSKSAICLSKQKETESEEESNEDTPTPPLMKSNQHDAREKKQDPPEKDKSKIADRGQVGKETKPNIRHEKKETDDGQPNVEMSNSVHCNNIIHNGVILNTGLSHRVEEDFDRLQEDLVSKLVVEEESPKGPQLNSSINITNVGTTTQPPPNLVPPPVHDQWYYQDPQGDLQGPFISTEMAEWFKAGYFSNSLRVRRQCDNSFYTLGDLVRICNGNPFLTTVRIPPSTETAKMPDQDLLNLHLLQAQLALRHVPPRGYKPEWAGLSPLQQRDLLSQHMLAPQMPPVDIQYLQQTAPPPTTTNPLMHIISQMQQVNKLPGQPIPEQPPNTIPVQLDPLQALVQQMHSLQRIQPPVTGIPGIGLPPNIQNENLVNNMTGLHGPIPGTGITAPNLSGLSSGLSAPGVIPTPLPPKPASLDSLSNANDNDPINSLLRQLQNKQLQHTQQFDSLWQQNQFVPAQANNQWQQPPASQPQPPPPPPQQQQQPPPTQTSQPISVTPEMPLSMWELQQSVVPKSAVAATPPEPVSQISPPLDRIDREQPQVQQIKEKETMNKEEKKKKEQEEKQAKKESEEKRKQEQKRLDQEKRAAEEKRKKEEEKRKKEEEKLKKLLEKAKQEAEEKKKKELEEKRKLKELKKAEEEARKKLEEQRKLEEQERERREQQKQSEILIKSNHEAKIAKAAPWSQSNISGGQSLADIQKAEREKRAEQVLLQQQQQRAQQQQSLQEQQTIEKPSSMQLSWANKPVQPRQVKSLAEIQAEEQERLAKQMAESRLAQQQKEKETGTTTISAGIWHGQNLTWANNPSSQWSSAAAGFWDESTSQISVLKPSIVTKSNSTSAMTAAVTKQQPKQTKIKTKKEETVSIKTSNGPATEEFAVWCTKALANLNSTVDIPTFVGFLRDIESAAEVKEYCRDYLGDSPATYHFATQFLEKRRTFKPKAVAHKDDMCSPAPAITPNSHNSDFQEVKGKGKKIKKSKMTKVDARILGFSVTAAQDRINVGDRDYVENS